MKNVIFALTLVFLGAQMSEARPRSSGWFSSLFDYEEEEHLWEPGDGSFTRETWLETFGMGEKEMSRTSQKLKEIGRLLRRINGQGEGQEETAGRAEASVEGHLPQGWVGNVGSSRNNEGTRLSNTLDDNDCVMFTEEQADEILADIKRKISNSDPTHPKDHSRRKRKLFNFNDYVWRKWINFPIFYKFDGSHTEPERELIRGAIAHWEAQTCISFQEAEMNDIIIDNHILFTRQPDAGCKSYIGKVTYNPQAINLMANCLWEFGIPVHEIGHALGLWHEQQRADMESYININYENLDYLAGQFQPHNTLDLGVPYDYSSIMHYKPQSGSIFNKIVLEAMDPLYQHTMGQRVGLSFYDTMLINRAYCQDTCMSQLLPHPCERGGYQDPKNCSRCRCPDGFGGDFCETVAPSVNADCGGEILLSPSSDQVIQSPGYDAHGYSDRTECNWHIKAPAGYQVVLGFEGNFSVYSHFQKECYHWVEVKYRGNLTSPGPRFCDYKRPTAVLRSEGDEMMLLLRSNFTTRWSTVRRGFSVRLHAVSTNHPHEISPPTASPTPSPTTNLITTTPIPPGTSQVIWECDFEDSDRKSTFCGMTQDNGDEFDWTLMTGDTPSQETGPTGAFLGKWYAYIEASKPRQRGDTAILLSPRLQLKGSHCLSFHYHMFGFHIEKLRVFVVSQGITQFLWAMKGQQGTKWLHAMVDVELNLNDQFGFIGERGGEFSGDIAIDNLQIYTGVC